jgi:acyl-coenzyme A thioesterase PaaI-like protein
MSSSGSPSSPTPEALAGYAARWNAHPSLQHFGAVISFPDPGRVRVVIDPVPPSMRGGMGDDSLVNGGVLAAMCDLLVGCTAGLVDVTRRSATVQLSLRFERPLAGSRLVGEARVDRATGRLVFASAEIADGGGQICVRCQGLVSLARA